MYKSLSYFILRAKRRCDVRKILAATPSVILAVASVLFLAALINLMAVPR